MQLHKYPIVGSIFVLACLQQFAYADGTDYIEVRFDDFHQPVIRVTGSGKEGYTDVAVSRDSMAVDFSVRGKCEAKHRVRRASASVGSGTGFKEFSHPDYGLNTIYRRDELPVKTKNRTFAQNWRSVTVDVDGVSSNAAKKEFLAVCRSLVKSEAKERDISSTQLLSSGWSGQAEWPIHAHFRLYCVNVKDAKPNTEKFWKMNRAGRTAQVLVQCESVVTPRRKRLSSGTEDNGEAEPLEMDAIQIDDANETGPGGKNFVLKKSVESDTEQ